MRKVFYLLTAAVLFAANTQAQPGSEKEQRAKYSEAEFLVTKAIVQFRSGNVSLADSLVRQSIQIYPTQFVYLYAGLVMKESDIKGGNEVMDIAFQKVKSYPGERMILGRDALGRLLYMKKVTTLHEHAVSNLKQNRAFGNRNSLEKSYDRLIENQISYDTGVLARRTLGDDNFYKPRIIEQFAFRFEYWLLNNKYDEALKFLDDQPEKGFINKSDYHNWHVQVLLEQGKLEEALKVSKELKKPMPEYYSNYIQMLKGEMESPEKFFPQLYKDYAPETTLSKTAYDYAIVDLYFKRYDSAIEKLKTAIERRGKSTFFGYVLDEYQWKIFTALGEAYAGLKDFQKAKTNYEIALLYYPEYKPAIEALQELDVRYANEAASDKTPPDITITEPSLARGLKVTAAGEKVMVRGFAKDLSGLKEVSLNGKIIYSQQGGDFWGEVILASGINNVTVVATDMAGNKAVQQLEVQKADQAIVQPNIVPAGEKEGKNYALFVAAQNYTDNAIPSLENPVADAVKLKLILKSNYNFDDANIINLFNPESNDLRRQLLELTNLLQPEDKLVIFYAGHGIWVDKEKKGYWLLTDAKRNDTNTWLPNRDVLDLIAKIPARHTLLITDACFSGSVFKTRGLGAGAPIALQEMDNKISRIAITSGNDTEVPDESVFMKYLVRALSENKEKYLTAQKMFITQIIEAVMTESKTEPRYGTLELAGHVGGDFIFTKK